ncbi:MaoC/PaaZ C-terminal domain-containing protein [Acidocella sp.]|uniref:MaoC/PaaZ C-terminal domain-containing protein n=1 Tax=Acidocella sp. TaxID=50710 RepID=UPI003D014265
MTRPSGADPAFRLEDIVVGRKELSGTYVVSEAEIIDFGERYDPLPIHIDIEVAKASPFGGIIAAGGHMLAIKQLLLHDFSYAGGVIASLGHDEVRFLKPLRGGATCQVEIEWLAATPSTSKPERGTAVIGLRLLADGIAVMTLKDLVLMKRRVES